MTREQKINAITRLVIILTLIGFLFLNNIKMMPDFLVLYGTQTDTAKAASEELAS